MSLAKTSVVNGAAVAIRMAMTLLVNKLSAEVLGPSGFAVVAQFQNALTTVTTLGAGAISTGVTKYTAEHAKNPIEQAELWRTSVFVMLVSSILAATLLQLGREFISIALFGDARFKNVISWTAAALVFTGVNALLLAILNGRKQILRLTAANVVGSLCMAALSGVLIWQMHLEGALLALGLCQAIAAIFTVAICWNVSWLRHLRLNGPIRWDIVANLGRFVVMSGSAAIAAPLVQIAIREHISSSFDTAHAGLWDAANRLSASGLMLLTTTLSVYYLPKLAELDNYRDLRAELKQGLRTIVPLAAVACALVFIWRHEIVRILFSPRFQPMVELLSWQLCGDVLKIASWLPAYLLIAKARVRAYVASEFIFTITLYLLTVAGVTIFGFIGVSIAYCLNYGLYLAAMLWLVFTRGART